MTEYEMTQNDYLWDVCNTTKVPADNTTTRQETN